MSEINPAFVDVNFEIDPNYVFGCVGPGDAGTFAAYEDVEEMIPESEWPKLSAQMDADGGGLDALATRIFDQGPEGSCVANATSQAHETVQAYEFGKDKVIHLSAISLYKRIGSSPQSGSMVSDALKEMASRGILPLDNAENRARFGDKVMPNTGFYGRFPAGWEDTAKEFRGAEWNVIRSVNGIITALFKRRPVVVGRAGHSICYMRPVYKGRDLYVKYANSWKPSWGDKGFGYDSRSMIERAAGWCFCLRSIVTPRVLSV